MTNVTELTAQNAADSLRKAYNFPEALRVSEELGLEEEIMLSENGLNMMDFCSNPVVVARQFFSLEEFFLFYPLANKSWRPLPNQLDSILVDNFSKAIYFPQDAQEVYYSAADKDSIRNIYHISYRDTIWSSPELVNEDLTSTSNDIYPMLSNDGKSLYFASEGLYGMGGYDLYVSNWNEVTGDWDPPTNMGFPYSSPYDDFLFINTEDGKYSIFASNRDCSEDSVGIYVLAFDNMPIRRGITDAESLKQLCQLVPTEELSAISKDQEMSSENHSDNIDVLKYTEQMTKVNALRDSINNVNRELQSLRSRVAEERSLTAQLVTMEMTLPSLQAMLDKEIKALQVVEMEFLASGVVFDADKVRSVADREMKGSSSGYAFTKRAMGDSLSLLIEEREEEIDYSFKIVEEANILRDQVLPEGVVYQIQIISTTRALQPAELKGLSPVFERNPSPQRFVYSVGLFKTYADVLSQLNTVKRLGFRSAFITSYIDGKSVSASTARAEESKVKQLYRVTVSSSDGNELPELTLQSIKSLTDKDIIRKTEEGKTILEVGPFNDKEEAENLQKSLEALGMNLTIQLI